MGIALVRLLVCFAAFGSGPAVYADPLTGDATAADANIMAIVDNPANAAFLDRTQVGMAPELFKTETLYARYPGYETATLSESGIGNLISKPSFIYKPNARFSLGGYVVPPLGLEIDIKKERLPVMLLGTLNYIDLLAKGRLNGAGQILVGYRASSSLGIGVSASYESVGFNAELVPSEGGDKLADITGNITNVNAKLGLRYEISSAIAVGLSFGLFSQNSQDLQIESPLLSQAPDSGGDSQGTGGGAVTNPADSFLLGVNAALAPRFRLLADVKYQRASPGQESFSLVDLKNKKRDVYDTVAFRSGVSLGVAPAYNALLGFRYEPASVGPGSPGEDGTAGFGTIDLVSIFAGFDTLRPYYQYSAGLRFNAGWVAERPSKKKNAPPQGYHQWETSFGLVYRIASLGVDENGELPGAYLQKKIFIPVTVIRKF